MSSEWSQKPRASFTPYAAVPMAVISKCDEFQV